MHVLERTRNFTEDDKAPYFLWDREITVAQFRAILRDRNHRLRTPLLRVLLREARPDEVWQFVTPHEVMQYWELIAPGLGRRRKFWTWLLQSWRELGFLR